MKIYSKSYKRVFGGAGMPFITSWLFAYCYREVDFLITWKNNVWTAFMKKSMIEKTLDKGVYFYSDKELLVKFKFDYQKHFKESIAYFESIMTKTELSKKEVEKFFVHAEKTLLLYLKCEFFFTDKAFEKAQNNELLANNLKEFVNIKNPGKKQIIRVYFNPDSYLYKLINILAVQFSIKFEDLLTHNKFELIDLFKGKRLSLEEINARKDYYILIDENNKTILLHEEKHSGIINKLLPKLVEKTEFKGTIANKGKVQANAKVFNHGYEFYKVPKLIEEMNKGDVLVTETTSPELLLACKKASAIVTNEGGLLSHAAIVSRELGIPCIVAAEGVTTFIKTGDLLEVDADKGVVRKLN